MGNHTDIGYIFLYVAAFGFSDYIIRKFDFEKNDTYYFIYYFSLLLIGLLFITKPFGNYDSETNVH